MKILRVAYTVLHEEEVPDDFIWEDAKELMEERAEDYLVDGFYSDVEWQVCNK